MAKFINGITFKSKEEFDKLYQASANKTHSNYIIDSALIPHGHLRNTNKQVFKILNNINPKDFPKLIITLATSHYTDKNILIDYDVSLESGMLRGSKSYGALIKEHFAANGINLEEDYESADKEHSWRVFLAPFKERSKEYGIDLHHVSILCGDLSNSEEKIAKILDHIQILSSDKILILISGDLSHIGINYKDSTQYIPEINQSNFKDKLIKFDQSAIEKIKERNYTHYYKHIHDSSYCARSQVAVMQGLKNNHYLFEDYKINFLDASERDFDLIENNLFTSAVIAFGRKVGSEQLCKKLKILADKKQVYLYHVCTNELFKLNYLQAQVLGCLLDSNDFDIDKLIMKVSKTIKANNLAQKIKEIMDWCKEHRLLAHHYDYENQVADNFDSLKESIKDKITYYSAHGFNEIDASIVKANWDQFNSIEGNVEDSYIRFSSGSTGADNRLKSVYSNFTYKHRQASAMVDFPPLELKTIILNRVDNLASNEEEEKEILNKLIETNHGARLAIIPNPYLVEKEVWDKLYNYLNQIQYKIIIHSDPHILNAFCFYLSKEQKSLKTVFQVELSHSYLWSFMKKNIKEHLNCKIKNKFMSSELMYIADECPLGVLHLQERNIHYDFRPYQAEGINELIASTMDTENRALINYATGDLIKKTTCKCHLKSQAIVYLGRKTDLIKNGVKTFNYSELDQIISAIENLLVFQIENIDERPIIYLKFINEDTENLNIARSHISKHIESFEVRELVFTDYKRGKFKPILTNN